MRPVHAPFVKGLKAEQGQPALRAMSRSGGRRRRITSNKNLGSPGTDDPKHLLAELLCAPAVSRDYHYSQPGSLKVPTRVCQPAGEEFWPAKV